jgi:hypothetical protein
MADSLDPVKAEFRNFLYLMWAFLRLPEPTPVQYDIALYLQHGPRRRMVQAFRGVGKSWITAAFVLWRLYCNPNERILVVSASKDRADAFSTFLKRCIAEWPLLADLKPEPGMRDSNIAFDVGGSDPHQAPSVRSVGITGQLTGGRATIIVPDDVETPKNSLTTVMREKLGESVKEFDAVLVPDGEVVYLGTPQTEMSLYNSLPERGYDVRIWPSRYPKSIDKYGGKLAPIIVDAMNADQTLINACHGRGAPTDPRRFTDIDLLEREASYGRSGFALQFQLDTSLSDADRYPLKLGDLMVFGFTPDLAPVRVAWGSGVDQIRQDLPVVGMTGDRWYRPMYIAPDFVDFQGCVMAIDPSGRGSDETGFAVIAMCNGFLYVLEAGGLKGGYDDATLETLARIALRNKVKKIVIEDNFGDGMYTKLFSAVLTRIYPCTVEEIHSSQMKEARIVDTLEPVFNQHRVIFHERVVTEDAKVDEQKYQLFYQMTRITKDRGSLAKYDRLDALAMGVAYWVEAMEKDVSKVEDEHRAEALQRELESFMEGVFGHAPAPPSWIGNLRTLR